jgi:hypothetical protein
MRTLRNEVDGSEQAPFAVKEGPAVAITARPRWCFPRSRERPRCGIVVRDIRGIPERVFAWDLPATR